MAIRLGEWLFLYLLLKLVEIIFLKSFIEKIAWNEKN